MSWQQEFCKIVYDHTNGIFRWICHNLSISADDITDGETLGFYIGDRLIGGLIYHNIRRGRDLWWTIYTVDKRWCTRKILKQIFGIAFDIYHVQRISILVNSQNLPCLKLITRLGFKREGCLRAYDDNGADSYIYGLLKSENLWKGKINE